MALRFANRKLNDLKSEEQTKPERWLKIKHR